MSFDNPLTYHEPCGIAKVVKMWATTKATPHNSFGMLQNGINTQVQHQSITTDFPLHHKDTKKHRNTQTQAAKKLRNTGQLCNCCATPRKTKRQPTETQLIIFLHREPVGLIGLVLGGFMDVRI